MMRVMRGKEIDEERGETRSESLQRKATELTTNPPL